jgi:hypothetical protein
MGAGPTVFAAARSPLNNLLLAARAVVVEFGEGGMGLGGKWGDPLVLNTAFTSIEVPGLLFHKIGKRGARSVGRIIGH